VTIPFERSRSIKQTKDFLVELCDSSKTPRVPKQVRESARFLLRHYPSEYEMRLAAEKAPDLFSEKF
jgi:hypothetical protein